MAHTEYDLIVIGAGPGGYVAAIRAAQLGWKVACIDKEEKLGGTCLRVGCIPSKALLESSALYWEARNSFQKHGIRAKAMEFDLATMLDRKDQVVSKLAQGIRSLFKKNKIESLTGSARIERTGRVSVETEGGEKILEGKNILIATGSRPVALSGVEKDGKRITTSREALCYEEVPERLLVIGAGYIGLELGSVWNRLGSKVTVLETLQRVLPGVDKEIAKSALRSFKKQGIDFHFGVKVAVADVKNGEVKVTCEDGDSFEGDRLLVAVGRAPNTEGLHLEDVGIETDEKGFIRVDDRYATTVEGIFAIGDVVGGAMLAHKAEEEGIACVEKLITGYGHVCYEAIPAVVYTEPEIASVGKTEEQLSEEDVNYRRGSFPFQANGRAQGLGQTAGKVKVLADNETDRVLGVHIIGPRAGDLIAEASVAVEFGASSEDLARCVHAHPTLAEALKEASLAVHNRSIHS